MTHQAKSRQAKPRSHRVILVCAAALAVLLLLLRLFTFVRGRH